MKLVFVHGWGSGPFVWDKVIPLLNHNDYDVLNLGFVGDENISIPDEKFIGISHSLGSLWLLKSHPEKLSGLVSIAGFNCFYKHIPIQILAKMKKNIIQDTTKQLSEFWHHAGLDQPGGLKNINPLKLAEALGWLSSWSTEIPDSLPVKALAARDDYIVPAEMSEDIWQDHSIEWIKRGGHMLPLTRPEWCADNIKRFLNDIK